MVTPIVTPDFCTVVILISTYSVLLSATATVARILVKPIYRVAQHVADLGWVDFDFGCSTSCFILLRLVRDGQKWQISGA